MLLDEFFSPGQEPGKLFSSLTSGTGERGWLESGNFVVGDEPFPSITRYGILQTQEGAPVSKEPK